MKGQKEESSECCIPALIALPLEREGMLDVGLELSIQVDPVVGTKRSSLCPLLQFSIRWETKDSIQDPGEFLDVNNPCRCNRSLFTSCSGEACECNTSITSDSPGLEDELHVRESENTLAPQLLRPPRETALRLGPPQTCLGCPPWAPI